MATLRLVYRSAFLLVVIIAACFFTPLVQTGRLQPGSRSARATAICHRWIARALGIRVRVHGEIHKHACLCVSNHISWFDISALGSVAPVRFLSKIEVKHWPVVGWLASRAGTLYIERGGKKSSKNAIHDMSKALKHGQYVCLFAEGTTTDGHIRKFHSRLIQSAIDAGCPVQPVAIHYPPPAGISDRVHPDVLFVGKTTMAESSLKVLRSKKITVDIYFLPVISSEDRSRDELAQLAQSAVADRLS